jgi:hypothetical protein
MRKLHTGRSPRAGLRVYTLSETDAKLAQKLGQLQPFIAVSPQECMGQLASVGPTQHLARSGSGCACALRRSWHVCYADGDKESFLESSAVEIGLYPIVTFQYSSTT